MKINEIVIDPTKAIEGDPLRLRVGTPVVEGGHVVEKINFHPANREFNKGLEIDGPVYVVYFEGIPERRIIRAEKIMDIEAIKETKSSENAEAAAM